MIKSPEHPFKGANAKFIRFWLQNLCEVRPTDENDPESQKFADIMNRFIPAILSMRSDEEVVELWEKACDAVDSGE